MLVEINTNIADKTKLITRITAILVSALIESYIKTHIAKCEFHYCLITSIIR